MRATFHAHAIFFILITSPLCGEVPHLVALRSPRSSQPLLCRVNVWILAVSRPSFSYSAVQRLDRGLHHPGLYQGSGERFLLIRNAHSSSYTGVSVGLNLGAKRSGREADHSRPSSVEVGNNWS
jgi:hypothetical protein